MNKAELTKHRIVEIQTIPIEITFPKPSGKNSIHAGFGTELKSQIRIVRTDQGAIGWGHSLPESVNEEAINGRLLSDIFDPDVGVTNPEALYLDFALHDLAGSILNCQVHRLIEDSISPEVELYYGSVDMDDVELNLEEGIRCIIKVCNDIYEKGYRSLKIKIGRGFKWMSPEDGLRRDIDITRSIRKKFPDCRILVDANDALTCDECIYYLSEVVDCDLFWIEEPFPENEKDLGTLKTFLNKTSPKTLIADGETKYELEHVVKLSRLGLIDVVLMDIGKLGFTSWRHYAKDFMRSSTLISPHTCCNPLKAVYACHLADGFNNRMPIEAFSANCRVLDKDFSFLHQDSFLELNREPGFGLNLF